jgi:magnesium-transporting ATPase (P-type)
LLPLIIPGFFCNDTILQVKKEIVSQTQFSHNALDRYGKRTGKTPRRTPRDPAYTPVGTGGGDMLDEENEDLESAYVNEEYHIEGDPTETCIFELALKQFRPSQLKHWRKKYERIDEIPFDPSTKFMATLHFLPNLQDFYKFFGFEPDSSLHSSSFSAETSHCYVIFMKGSPEKVLQFCRTERERTLEEATMQDHRLKKWKTNSKELAGRGLRVLALAYKIIIPATKPDTIDENQESLKSILSLRDELNISPYDFTLTSMIGISDPPRAEAIDAITSAQKAGIMVKMITGDHTVTALAIGKLIGLQNNKHYPVGIGRGRGRTGTNRDFNYSTNRNFNNPNSELSVDSTTGESELRAITGPELETILAAHLDKTPAKDALITSNTELDKLDISKEEKERLFDETVLKYDVFARCTAVHKLHIVQSLQRQGLICSMTGDGVSDAPALKAANVGISMGITGTEIAKDSSKMILLDDNFATIVDSIRIARCTYQNIIKVLLFVLPVNGAQAFCIITALILRLQVPYTGLQVLWISLITAISLGIVLAFEPVDEAVMNLLPRKTDKRVFGGLLLWRIFFIIILFVSLVLLNETWERSRGISSLRELHTIGCNTLCFLEIAYLFNCRSVKRSIFDSEAISIDHENGISESRNACSRTILGNNMIYFGIFFIIAFQMFFTYAPFMNGVFLTKGLDGISWGKIVMFAVAAFFIIELEKLATGRFIRQYNQNHGHGERKGNHTRAVNGSDKAGSKNTPKQTSTIVPPVAKTADRKPSVFGSSNKMEQIPEHTHLAPHLQEMKESKPNYEFGRPVSENQYATPPEVATPSMLTNVPPPSALQSNAPMESN